MKSRSALEYSEVQRKQKKSKRRSQKKLDSNVGSDEQDNIISLVQSLQDCNASMFMSLFVDMMIAKSGNVTTGTIPDHVFRDSKVKFKEVREAFLSLEIVIESTTVLQRGPFSLKFLRKFLNA
jgi:hypothetical protein